MKTTCNKCREEFKLDIDTVYIGTEQYAPHDNVVVIKCPHCKKRTEI